MNEVNEILKRNIDLLGREVVIKKLTIGFNNDVYKINDDYAMKVFDDEDSYLKTTKFIENYKGNPYILEYIIYEEFDGIRYVLTKWFNGLSLFSLWSNLSDLKREEIVKQISGFMKNNNKVSKEINWLDINLNRAIKYLNKINNLNVNEFNLIKKAISKFDRYLSNNEVGTLIHNDLHFGNILYDGDSIKVIDFDRSLLAPRDYDLSVLFHMVSFPHLFLNEGEHISKNELADLPVLLEKYYPDLFDIKFLKQRLAIYQLIYNLKKFVSISDSIEIKKEIFAAVNIILYKDELLFEQVKSVDELMLFLDLNISFGWLDYRDFKHLNNLKNFRQKYRTSSFKEILETGVGTCIEQVKLCQIWFNKHKIESKIFFHRCFDSGKDDNIRLNCIFLFKRNDNWYHFEHTNLKRKGIHRYSDLNSALVDITVDFKKGMKRSLTEIPYIPDHISFHELNIFINEFEKYKF